MYKVINHNEKDVHGFLTRGQVDGEREIFNPFCNTLYKFYFYVFKNLYNRVYYCLHIHIL